jgi:hypothetical protein
MMRALCGSRVGLSPGKTLYRRNDKAAAFAKAIVMAATEGKRDPVRLRERAIEIISGLPSEG